MYPAGLSGMGQDWPGSEGVQWWAMYETGQLGGSQDIYSGVSGLSMQNSTSNCWTGVPPCNTLTSHNPGGGGMSNYLLADGHAKFLNASFVSPGITAAASTNAENATSNAAGFYSAVGTSDLGSGNFVATFSPV